MNFCKLSYEHFRCKYIVPAYSCFTVALLSLYKHIWIFMFSNQSVFLSVISTNILYGTLSCSPNTRQWVNWSRSGSGGSRDETVMKKEFNGAHLQARYARSMTNLPFLVLLSSSVISNPLAVCRVVWSTALRELLSRTIKVHFHSHLSTT